MTTLNGYTIRIHGYSYNNRRNICRSLEFSRFGDANRQAMGLARAHIGAARVTVLSQGVRVVADYVTSGCGDVRCVGEHIGDVWELSSQETVEDVTR